MWQCFIGRSGHESASIYSRAINSRAIKLLPGQDKKVHNNNGLRVSPPSLAINCWPSSIPRPHGNLNALDQVLAKIRIHLALLLTTSPQSIVAVALNNCTSEALTRSLPRPSHFIPSHFPPLNFRLMPRHSIGQLPSPNHRPRRK